MNKRLFYFVAIAFSASTLFANAMAREESYGGKCLYIDKQEEEQDFKSCQVNLKRETLEVKFEEEENQDNNKTIRARSINQIASGAYATQLLSDSGSAVSGLLLGPVNSVVRIFAPDRDYQQYVISYQGANRSKMVTILNIDRSDAPEFQQELSLITGKLITFRAGQTDNTINVGPDKEDILPSN